MSTTSNETHSALVPSSTPPGTTTPMTQQAPPSSPPLRQSHNSSAPALHLHHQLMLQSHNPHTPQPQFTMECPVCSELFVDPVTLPCSHSLCMRCVGYCLAVVDGPNLDQAPGGPGPIISAGSALRSSNRSLRMSSGGGGLRASSRAGSTTSTIPRSVLKCPVCKSECNPNSATINKQLCLAVEELRMADLMCEDHPSEPSVRASVICNACIPPIRLCDECNARVHRGPRFKGHLSGSVVLLHPGTPPPARTFCRKHTSELVRFYCPVHDVILCQICVCDSHPYDGCISIEAAALQYRTDLQKKCRTVHEVVKFVSDAAQPFSLSASVIARKQEYIASILTVLCEKLLAIDSTRITEIKGTIHSTLTNDVSSITEQHKNLSALVHSLCTQLSELESATETLPDTVLLRKRNELSEVLDVLYNRLHSTGAMEVGHSMHGHPVAEFVIMKETVRQLMSFPGEVYNTLHSLPEHSNDKGCTQLCTIVPALHTASMHLVPQIGSKMCKDHQNQVLDMVCTQDKCLICVHCSIYGAHAKHECILLKDAIASALNDLTDKDESISKLLVTAQAHHKQAEVIANMLQKSAVQSGQEAISILNKIVTTWHINVTELFSTTETQLTGALQQLAAFQKTIFALISSLNNMSSAVKALRKLGQFSLLSAITRISTIPPPASASASASQTTATTTTTTTTSSRSASAAPIIPPMPLAPETTTPSSPFVMRAAAERHSDADSAVAFLHAYALLRPKLAPPAAVPEPPAGLDRLASGFPRLTESEAVLQDAQAALAAKELELSESQAHHASLEAQLQAAQHETQAHRARIEELRGEIARLKGIDYGANDGTANLLNDPQTGGQCKVVQYAFTGGAGNYKSNCGGPSEAWCANGCLIDTQPTSRTTSTRAANSVGTTWTNNTASGIGILVVDIGRSAAVRTVVFFQMCSDGKTTRIKLSYHSKKGGAQAPQHDAPGWTDWGIGWADVADLNNSRDGGLTVDASNTWQVNFETQFLKIEVRNSGAYGNPSYIELRQLKAFSS